MIKKNLGINHPKCHFSKLENDWLGYHISQLGIWPIESKTSAILALEAPKTLKNLRSFLGSVHYIIKFNVNNLAKIGMKGISRGAKLNTFSLISRQLGDIQKIFLKVATQKQHQCFLAQINLEFSCTNLLQNLLHILNSTQILITSPQINITGLLKNELQESASPTPHAPRTHPLRFQIHIALQISP